MNHARHHTATFVTCFEFLTRLSVTDLIDDNINDDCTCAKYIWQVQGWTAWHGWVRECQEQPLPDLSSCF